MERPAAFVDGVVVSTTQRQEVVEVGTTAVPEPVDVMRLAMTERHRTVRYCAGLVHGSQGAPLGAVRQPHGAAELDHDAIAVENKGNDVGEARQPPDGLDRELDPRQPVLHPRSSVVPGRQRVEVDEQEHLGSSVHHRHVVIERSTTSRSTRGLLARRVAASTLGTIAAVAGRGGRA